MSEQDSNEQFGNFENAQSEENAGYGSSDEQPYNEGQSYSDSNEEQSYGGNNEGQSSQDSFGDNNEEQSYGDSNVGEPYGDNNDNAVQDFGSLGQSEGF